MPPANPSSEKRFDVVALGEAMLEFNQTQPGQPNYLQGYGGDTSNAVIAAARAGAAAAYLSRLGDDWFGVQLRALWASEGVDASAVETDPARPTGIYFVTHDAGGHRFSYLRAGSAASAMTPHWLPRATLRQARILHVSGISLAISPNAGETVLAAMREASAHGSLVSFDSNLRLKLWPLERARQVIDEAIGLCDIFLPSQEDMDVLIGQQAPDAIIDWAHKKGAKTVVLKLGAQGCAWSATARAARCWPCARCRWSMRPAPATAFAATCWRAWQSAQVFSTRRAMRMPRRRLRCRALARWRRCRAGLPSMRRLPPATWRPEPSFRSVLHHFKLMRKITMKLIRTCRKPFKSSTGNRVSSQ